MIVKRSGKTGLVAAKGRPTSCQLMIFCAHCDHARTRKCSGLYMERYSLEAHFDKETRWGPGSSVQAGKIPLLFLIERSRLVTNAHTVSKSAKGKKGRWETIVK